MSAMIPPFAPCVSEGETFSMTRSDLRSALAEGAYRLALSQSLDEEVVVTGTRDKSKSVQCRRLDSAGTHMRRNICMTEAQWEARERDQEYAAKDAQRQAREYVERRAACISRSLFPGDGSAGPCLMN